MNHLFKKLKDKVIRPKRTLEEQNKFYKECITMMSMCICTLGVLFMCSHTSYLSAKESTEFYKQNFVQAYTSLQSMSATVVDLEEMMVTLDEQNKEYKAQLLKFEEREELFDKYEYAIMRGNNRTDITYDQLITLEQLVAESSIKDEDLILALIMTESGGNAGARNSTSTAKGYGQFLDGTAKFTYTQLMGKDNWYPEVALDGDVGLEMTVAYVNYLVDRYDNDLYGALRSYRGKQDISGYVAKLDSFLSTKGKSVNDIAYSLNTLS